jgi:hypothetical protein
MGEDVDDMAARNSQWHMDSRADDDDCADDPASRGVLRRGCSRKRRGGQPDSQDGYRDSAAA